MFVSITTKINLNLKQNKGLIENSKNIFEDIEKNYLEIYKDTEKVYISSKKEDLENIWVKIKKFLQDFPNLEINFFSEEVWLNSENKEYIIYIAPYSNFYIKWSWENFILKFDNEAEKNFSDEAKFSSWEKIRKITLKFSWKYVKIDIISNNYIISNNKKYKLFEDFWNKRVFKEEWFLKIN